MELKCLRCQETLRADMAKGPREGEPLMRVDDRGKFVVCRCGERNSLELAGPGKRPDGRAR